MGWLKKENLNYFSIIEQFFLDHIKVGSFLSARDIQIIKEWQKKRYPVDLVCKGIKKGIEHFSKTKSDLPLSLFYYRKWVDEEIKSSLIKKVGERSKEKKDENITKRIEELISKLAIYTKKEKREDIKKELGEAIIKLNKIKEYISKKGIYYNLFNEIEEIDKGFLNEIIKNINENEKKEIDKKAKKITERLNNISSESFLDIKLELLRERWNLPRISI